MGAVDGLTAVVTGGASGIGRATAELLVKEGALVVVLDLQSPSDMPPGVHAVQADISDDGSVRAAVEEAVRILGGIDLLANVAGIGAAGGVAANDDDEWHRVLDVNVLGLVRVTRAALPALCRSHHAAIVNTGSIAAWAGLPERVLYSASKGAVHAASLAMAADLLADGIRVNVVQPGTADTPWVQRLLSAAADP